ncbi:MAG TPA: lipopolysaccharide transport periplasmic protein LptA [Gammaproteobacteria bacterium]|nr:lipopolysaccharide transport periplasmic protein LptA [Gammaproteobacteria bacterium]
MPHPNNALNKFMILALLQLPAAAMAKTSDAEQPIHIEADQVEIRDREGLSIYRGNVHIVQGSLRISGNEIRIRDADQGLQKVTITGQPATFYQLTDLNEEISAQGQQMEYHSSTGLLILERDAVLVQRDNRFTSEHIVYNTQTNVVKAGTDENKAPDSNATPPRVTITIMPEKTAPEPRATDANGTPPIKPNTEKK